MYVCIFKKNVDTVVNSGLWVLLMCQRRLISCNKWTILGGMSMVTGGGAVHVWA